MVFFMSDSCSPRFSSSCTLRMVICTRLMRGVPTVRTNQGSTVRSKLLRPRGRPFLAALKFFYIKIIESTNPSHSICNHLSSSLLSRDSSDSLNYFFYSNKFIWSAKSATNYNGIAIATTYNCLLCFPHLGKLRYVFK